MARSCYGWYKFDTRIVCGRQSNPYGFLRDDLYLSDESDGEQEIDPVGLSPNITAGRSLSPAVHDSSSAVNLNEESLPQVKNLLYAPKPIIQPPPPNLSSESGSESDTTNDDSLEEYVTLVTVPKMISPLSATPPIHNSRSAVNLNKGTLPQVRKHDYAPMPIIKPLLTSSSESDSESNSDTDDSDGKTVGSSSLHSTPAEHVSTYTKREEESNYRWNLASFGYLNDQSSVTSAPPNSTSPDSGKPPTDNSGSIISRFSEPDSDQGVDKQLGQGIVENQQPSATTKSAHQHMPPNTTKSTTRYSKNKMIPPVTVGKVVHIVPDKVIDNLAKRGIKRLRNDSNENNKKKLLKKRGRKPNGATSFSNDDNGDQRHKAKFTTATLTDDDTSDDDSDGPFLRRRKQKSRSGTKPPLNKDDKKSDQKKELKNRSEVETKKSDSRNARKKKDGASSSIRRKRRPRSSARQPKSAEYVPTSYDSSSDTDTGNTVKTRPKRTVNALRNSSEELYNNMFGPDSDLDISAKKTPKIKDIGIKANKDKNVYDKNKNEALRRIFIRKKCSEGDKDRASSLLGQKVRPLTNKTHVEPKIAEYLPPHCSSNNNNAGNTVADRPKPKVNASRNSSEEKWYRLFGPDISPKKTPKMIDNDRKVNENKVDIGKNKNDTIRKLFTPKRDSAEGKGGEKGGNAANEDIIPEIIENESESKKGTKSQDASAEYSGRAHESMKRKRKTGSSSESSHSTISNISGQSKKTDHRFSHDSQYSENEDKVDYRKVKRLKEEGNHPHDSIDIEGDQDCAKVLCSQSQSQTENIRRSCASPSNNGRVPIIEEQQLLMRHATKDPGYSMDTITVIPEPPIERTNVPPTFMRREYHSHFQPLEDLRDHEIRGQNQYLMEAMRLKKTAEREPDPIKQCMLYLEAVQYFLLTNHAMESAFLTENAAFTMYRDTLTQIQHIATTFRKPQNTSPVFHKLDVLSYRCQAVLFYKLFAMSMDDARKIQKRMGDYCDKHLQCPVTVDGPTPIMEHLVHAQGQGTLPHLSPSPPPGTVGSVKRQSSGYNSGGTQLAPGGAEVVAESSDAAVWIPLPICNAMAKMHHHLGYLLSFQELWDMADNLVIKGNYTNFFNELDRSCKPLSMHSSMIDVVRYVREGIRRLRCES